jgi:hypothetical protein
MAKKKTPIQKAKAALSGKTTRAKVAAAEKAAMKPKPKPKPKPKAKKKSVRKSVSDNFWK